MRTLKRLMALFFVFLFACSGRKPHQHAFYYWKTTFNYDDTTLAKKIAGLRVQRFYIKYFDIDWSENLAMPVPRGEVGLYSADNYIKGNYVPVVFITSKTFERISDVWVDTLAQRLTRRISSISSNYENFFAQEEARKIMARDSIEYTSFDSVQSAISKQRAGLCDELQFDCDWTEKGKEKYFTFLKKMKQLNPGKAISTTIRLYPFKYQKRMGVPPVDRGVLMCYNMSNIRSAATGNSIFDVDELKSYMDGKEYPLPLDIALPIFSWQAWFRGGQFKGIVHTVIVPSKFDSSAFDVLSDNMLRMKTDTVINDVYYREGDELRMEAPRQEQLVQAMDVLHKKLPAYGRIIFFDWNMPSVTKYEKTIQEIFNRP